MDKYQVKGHLLMGTNSLLDVQFSKKFNSFEAFAGYSGFVQNSHIYNSVNVGIRKGAYSLLFTHKLLFQTQFRLSATHRIADRLSISSSINGNINQTKKLEADLSVRQQIDDKSQTSLSLIFNPYYKELGFKVEYERSISKNHRILFCTQYSDDSSVLYFGYKNVNFNFVFPFVVFDSALPTIFGLIGFGLAYLYRKKWPQKKYQALLNDNGKEIKKQSDRQEELRLIGQKAADNYVKERNQPKGLLIEEAYIGPPGQLQLFMSNPQRHILLLRNEEVRSKFVDLTVSLRFYVTRGELKLRKGDKVKVLGFYRSNENCTRIGVRFKRQRQVHVVYFNYEDEIVIEREV